MGLAAASQDWLWEWEAAGAVASGAARPGEEAGPALAAPLSEEGNNANSRGALRLVVVLLPAWEGLEESRVFPAAGAVSGARVSAGVGVAEAVLGGLLPLPPSRNSPIYSVRCTLRRGYPAPGVMWEAPQVRPGQ